MTVKEMLVVKKDPEEFAVKFNEYSQMAKSRKRYNDNQIVVGVEYQYFAMPKGESFGFIILELDTTPPGRGSTTPKDKKGLQRIA